MKKWLTRQEELPPFEDALIDWVIINNQAFVVVESKHFWVMLKAGGCHYKVPRADTIASRIQLRVS